MLSENVILFDNITTMKEKEQMSDYSREKELKRTTDMFRRHAEEFRLARKKSRLRNNPEEKKKKVTTEFEEALKEKRKLEGTWILPKNLGIFQSVQDMGELTLPLDEFLETCVQSLSVNKNVTQLRTLSQKWKTDGWMQLLFGRIWKISRTKIFTEKWTSYLGESPANRFLTQDQNGQTRTNAFYTQVFLRGSDFADQLSLSSKTLMALQAAHSTTPEAIAPIQKAFSSISCGILRTWDTKVISSAAKARMSVFPLGEGVYLLGQSEAISTIKKHYSSLLTQTQSTSSSRRNPLLTKNSLGNPLVLPNSFEAKGEPIQIEAMLVNSDLLSRDELKTKAPEIPYDSIKFRNWSAPTAQQNKNINNKKPVKHHSTIDRLRMYAAEVFLREYFELHPEADSSRFAKGGDAKDDFYQEKTWKNITNVKKMSLSFGESLMGLPLGWTDPYLGWEFTIPKTLGKDTYFLLDQTGVVPAKEVLLDTRVGKIKYDLPIPEEAFEEYLQKPRKVSEAVDKLRIDNNYNIRPNRMEMIGNGVCPQVAYLGIDACFQQILADRSGKKTFLSQYNGSEKQLFTKPLQNSLEGIRQKLAPYELDSNVSKIIRDYTSSEKDLPKGSQQTKKPSDKAEETKSTQGKVQKMTSSKLVLDAVSLIEGSCQESSFGYFRDTFALNNNKYKIYDYNPNDVDTYKAISDITVPKAALSASKGNISYFYHPVFGILGENVPLGISEESPNGKDEISVPGLLSISSLWDLRTLQDHSGISHNFTEVLAKHPQGSRIQLYLPIEPTVYLSIRQNFLRPLYEQLGSLPIDIVWGVPKAYVERKYSFEFPDLPLGVRSLKKLASGTFVFENSGIPNSGLVADTTDLKIDEIVLYSLLFQNYTFRIDFPVDSPDIFVLFVGFKTVEATNKDCYRAFYNPYLATIRPYLKPSVLSNADPSFSYHLVPNKPFLPCVFKYDDLGIDKGYLDSLKKDSKIFTFIFLLLQTVLKENAESGVPETLWRFILKNEQQFSINPLTEASKIFTNYISAIPNPAWKILGK